MKRLRVALLCIAWPAACSGGQGEQPASAAEDSASSPGASSAAAVTDTSPPVFGIAVSDTAGAWCAMFPTDSARPIAAGRVLSIVFGDSTAPLSAVVVVRRTKECHAEFGQSRWYDYTGYDLALRTVVDTTRPLPIVGMAVASNARWSRGVDGVVRADLNGDGRLEEIRRCSADEGHHFTVWRIGADRRRERIGHEYYDWGGLVERTCGPGEDGIDSTTAPGTTPLSSRARPPSPLPA